MSKIPLVTNLIRLNTAQNAKSGQSITSKMNFSLVRSTVDLPETGQQSRPHIDGAAPQLEEKSAFSSPFFEFKSASPQLTRILNALRRSSNDFSSASLSATENKSSLTINPSLLSHINNEKISTKASAPVALIGLDFSPENLMFSASLQKTADKYGVVIGIRYPSEVGQAHLREGHPTKNFHVKAKSSATGPTAGFIAEDPQYSKVEPDQWAKQQNYINEALSKGAQLVPLTLSQAQINNAMQYGNMKHENNNVYSANYHGKKVLFNIDPVTHMVSEENGKIVNVLTNPPETDGTQSINKAITADYDLFSLIPKENQSVNSRPIEIGHNVQLRKIKQEQSNVPKDYFINGGADAFKKAVETFSKPRAVNGKQDENKGNFHYFGETIIKNINQNVAEQGYQGGKLVWHGDEANNPYSPGFDVKDKPVFYIPNQSPQQITNLKQLSDFYNELRKNGYTPELSPKLGV